MTRIVLAGTGLIGARHLEAILADPALTLAAVVDPAPAGVVPAPLFADLAACDVGADALVIATPTATHADLAVAAAARGWHALVEKPIASSVAEARRTIDAHAAAGTRLLVGHHRRHHPRVAALCDAVAAGAIGRPVAGTLIWAMRKPDAYFDTPWRQGREGGPIRMNLIHEIDLLRFVLGEVVEVAALGGNPVRGTGRVEAGGALLRFEDGAVVTVAFADTAPSPWGFEAATGENPNIATTGQDSLRLTGTGGAVSFPSLTLWRGTDWHTPPVRETLDAPDGAPLARQLSHLADIVAGRAEPLCSGRDGLRALEVVEEIERRCEAGLAVAEAVA